MDTSWTKLGLRVTACGTASQHSHAMLPTPIHLGPVIRVFYSSCDADLRGRVFFADLSPTPPFDTIHLERRPVLDLGAGSDFDSDGVNPSQVVRDGDDLLLYYIGWRRRSKDIPYTLIAGLARSRDEGRSFEKMGPLLAPSLQEPYFRTAPFVYRDEDGWSALYIGGDRFIDGPDGKRLPVYSLRRAHSTDRVSWPDRGEVLLAPSLDAGEIGFGRPVLWHGADGSARLVLSRRTVRGYALMQSRWPIVGGAPVELEPLLRPGPDAWDSEMTCFGAFCQSANAELLLYNGNRFGRSGIGLASRGRVRPATMQDRASYEAALA